MPSSARTQPVTQFAQHIIEYGFNSATFEKSISNDQQMETLFTSTPEYNKLQQRIVTMNFSARRSISPLKKEIAKLEAAVLEVAASNIDELAKIHEVSFPASAKTPELRVKHFKKDLTTRKNTVTAELAKNEKTQQEYKDLKDQLAELERTQKISRKSDFKEWFNTVKESYDAIVKAKGAELDTYPEPSRGPVNFAYARAQMAGFDEAKRRAFEVLLERKELSSQEYKTSYTDDVLQAYAVKFAHSVTAAVDANFSARSAAAHQQGGVVPTVIEDVDFQGIQLDRDGHTELYETDLISDVSDTTSGAAAVRQLVKRYDEEVGGKSPRKGEAYLKITRYLNRHFYSTLANQARFVESVVFEKALVALIENFVLRFSQSCVAVLDRIGGVTMQSKVIHILLEPNYISSDMSYDATEQEIEAMWGGDSKKPRK